MNERTGEGPSSFDGEAGGEPITGAMPGGLLGATAEPLAKSLSAGVVAASSVLATVFLAGGVVRGESRLLVLGAAIAAGGVVALSYPLWSRMPAWRRVRVVLAALGFGGVAVVGVRGIQSILGHAQTTFFRKTAPPGAPDVLIVTAAAASVLPGATARGGWRRIDDAWAPSPRRDATLATVLTGEEPIEHRVLFDGDRPRRGARAIAEVLRANGYRTAQYTATPLPEWASDGIDDSPRGSVGDAVVWLTRSERPSYAHVHVPSLTPAMCRTIEAAAESGAEVVVVALPDGDAEGDDRLRVPLAWGSSDLPEAWSAGPRGLVSIAPTLLARIGVGDVPESADATPIFDAVASRMVVSIEHVEDGIHRIRAGFGEGVLRIGATPLGGHPTDDWSVLGATASHFVYRNDLAYEGSDGDVAKPPDRFLLMLEEWRRRNGRFEWSAAK